MPTSDSKNDKQANSQVNPGSPSALAANDPLQMTFLAIFRITRSIAAGLIAIAFPYLVLTTRHESAASLGFIYASASLATAVFGFFIGHLADTWGRRKALIIAGLMLPLSSAIVIFSESLPALFIASIVGGYSATGSLMGGGVGGAAQPIQSALIADLTTGERRTFFFSIFSFMSGVFASLGALLVRAVTVQEAFIVATLISAAGLPLMFVLKLVETRGSRGHLPSRIVIGKFTLTGALNGLTQGLVTPFLIPFFVIVYHLPKAQMSVYGFASGMLASFSLLTAPRFERRLGFVKSISFTRGLGAGLLVLMPLLRYFPFAMLVYLLTPALRVAAQPTQQTALTDMVNPEERGRALGVNQVARLTCSSGAVAFTGAMFNAEDIGIPFYLYGAITALNIYFYFRFFGATVTRPPAPELEP